MTRRYLSKTKVSALYPVIFSNRFLTRNRMMQPRHTRQLVLAALLPNLVGCLPATYTAVPRLTGRVVDSAGKPVAGAVVVVSVADDGTPSHGLWQIGPWQLDAGPWRVEADANGRFNRPEETHWSLAPLLPMDMMLPDYLAIASHGAARSQTYSFSFGIVNWHFFGLTNPTEAADFRDLVVRTDAAHR
jgi:hypothetical protein